MILERIGHPDVLLRLIAEAVEAALRHADDGERFVAGNDFLADNVGIQIETLFPKRPTDDRDGRGCRDVLRSDQAADGWAHAERFKEILSDVPAKNVLRLDTVRAHVVDVEGADDHVREDAIAVSHRLIGVPREITEPRLR